MLNKAKMATRNPKKVDSGNSTEFHLHKSQREDFAGIMHKIIDYTEHRLRRYIELTRDPQQRLTLEDLIKNYRKGHVAVAWRNGMPLWLPVTKEG